MRDIPKLEERIMWLTSLRNTSNPELSRERAYKNLLGTDSGKIVVIDAIEKYINLLSNLEKHEEEDKDFYELKGQLSIIDWLLGTVKENLADKKEEV